MAIQAKEKFFYASGAIANGVKNDAFTFFLLFGIIEGTNKINIPK